MLRIERDDLSRPQVLALLEEHLKNMYELSPPDKVFAFDAGKLKGSDITFWTAWSGELLLGCAALKELRSTEGEIKSMRTPSAQRRTGAGRALLNHIIEVARSRSYRTLYLERDPSCVPACADPLRKCGFHALRAVRLLPRKRNSVFMCLPLV